MVKHLLIVEDKDVLSESLARRFTRRGFRVSASSDPEEIVALVRGGDVDLVISDIDLDPPHSGLDVFRRVHADGAGVPFVFLSGHDEGSDSMAEARALGAVGTFTKPTEFASLLDCVCRALGVSVDATLLAAAK